MSSNTALPVGQLLPSLGIQLIFFQFGITLLSLKHAKLLLLPVLVRHVGYSLETGVAHCRSRLRVCGLICNTGAISALEKTCLRVWVWLVLCH